MKIPVSPLSHQFNQNSPLKIFLLGLLIVIAAAGNTYSQEKSNMIYVSFGAAVPMGDFKSVSDGAAKTGTLLDFALHHQFEGKKIGLFIDYRKQAHNIDLSDLEPLGYTITASGSWDVSTLLIGPVWKLKMSNNVFFQPRVLFGYLQATSPVEGLATGSYTFKISSSEGQAFAFAFGGNIRFDAGERISLLFNFDYLTATPNFQLNAVRNGTPQTASSDQQIASLNLSFGVGFRF